MRASGIQCADDIVEIEGQPYEDFMPHRTVLQGLEGASAEFADKRALSFIQSADPALAPLTWTHAELVGRIRQAARAFAALAGDDEPRVAFLLPAIPEAYFTLFGAEAVGVACPINYLLGSEHIAELIDAAGVNILVALGPHPDSDIWSRVPVVRERCPSLAHVIAVGGAPDGVDFESLLAVHSADALGDLAKTSPDDVAALFHTGGTTGRPKLAQHTQANQLHAAWGAARMYGASDRDIVLNGFPLFHVAGAFVYGLSILLAGGEVVLPTLLGLRNAAFVQAYWVFVERHRVTLLATVPTVISTLLGVARKDEDLSSVRCLLTGGSPLPTDLADSFEHRLGIGVRNILGMTECGGVIAIEPVGAPRVAGSVGLPLPFTEVQVFDESGKPVAGNEDGVLRICGPNVGSGYTDLKNNAGVFLAGGWLVTGDIGHIDTAGRLCVTGRSKDLIIRSGHNIDPLVIEDALLSHPEVLMAAAVGAPDEYAGEVPVAYVSLRPGSSLDAAALSAYAQAHIPERPAYPKAIFVLDTLPVTAIGKLFKPSLRALATRWVLEDRIERTGLSGTVRVTVEVETKGQVIRLHGGTDQQILAAVKEMMGGFALTYQVVPDALKTHVGQRG